MKKYLIAGLLVWVPLGVTVLVVKLVVDLMDRLLVLLPPAWRPEALLGFSLPGFGVIVALVVVLGTGIIVANLLGRRLVRKSIACGTPPIQTGAPGTFNCMIARLVSAPAMVTTSEPAPVIGPALPAVAPPR